jgi:hypothetical protein
MVTKPVLQTVAIHKDLRDESRRVQDALDGLGGDVSEVMPVG